MKKLLLVSIITVLSVGAYLSLNDTKSSNDDLLSQNIEALSAGEATTYPDALVEHCYWRNNDSCDFTFKGVQYTYSNMANRPR